MIRRWVRLRKRRNEFTGANDRREKSPSRSPAARLRLISAEAHAPPTPRFPAVRPRFPPPNGRGELDRRPGLGGGGHAAKQDHRAEGKQDHRKSGDAFHRIQTVCLWFGLKRCPKAYAKRATLIGFSEWINAVLRNVAVIFGTPAAYWKGTAWKAPMISMEAVIRSRDNEWPRGIKARNPQE